MKNVIHLLCIMGLTLGLQAPANAGVGDASPPAEPSHPGNWCEWLQSEPGILYKNSENPLLQSFRVGGRFQYQASYIDGEDANGRNFNDSYDEYRRVRLETKTEFLQFFSATIKLNMVSDGRSAGDGLDWGYDTFDEAIFSFDIKKAFGAGALDELKVNYGRFKFNMTEEVHMSATEMLRHRQQALRRQQPAHRRHARRRHGKMVRHGGRLQRRG
jgi:hypothetical protein